jgi:hypothetical protein
VKPVVESPIIDAQDSVNLELMEFPFGYEIGLPFHQKAAEPKPRGNYFRRPASLDAEGNLDLFAWHLMPSSLPWSAFSPNFDLSNITPATRTIIKVLQDCSWMRLNPCEFWAKRNTEASVAKWNEKIYRTFQTYGNHLHLCALSNCKYKL